MGKKLYPFYFLNNSVKPRSMLVNGNFWHTDTRMKFTSPAYIKFFVDSSTENQRNILFVWMVADDNMNYLHKFIMLNSKEDWILLHNLHVLRSYIIKN